jgi:hypothetical protein
VGSATQSGSYPRYVAETWHGRLDRICGRYIQPAEAYQEKPHPVRRVIGGIVNKTFDDARGGEPRLMLNAVPPRFQPMPLGRARDPFSHREWIIEVKWDGFRSLVQIDSAL